MTVEEALARAVAVVAENTELRAENATLRAYVQELEDQVEQLTQPATPVVPTEAAGRIEDGVRLVRQAQAGQERVGGKEFDAGGCQFNGER